MKNLILIITFIFLPLNALSDNLNLMESDKKVIGKIIRNYILDNPEIIGEAILLLQEKNEQINISNQKNEIKLLKNSILYPKENTIIGNKKGKITITEFFDYNCGYCKIMFKTIRKLIQEDDNLRIVLIEFPILGESSTLASRAALASLYQNYYSLFHQELMSFKGQLNKKNIFLIAQKNGINIKKLKNDMNKPEINNIIKRNKLMAKRLSISGTPAIIIGEKLIPGAIDEKELKEILYNIE